MWPAVYGTFWQLLIRPLEHDLARIPQLPLAAEEGGELAPGGRHHLA